MSERAAILDDEFLRPTPGLRPFSVGILRLCRKLNLGIATKGGDAPPGRPGLPGREDLAIAWMLDARNPLDTIKTVVAGPPTILEGILDEFEFNVSPAFLLRVKAEIAHTERAVQEAAFEVESKPGASQGPSPQGK